jgi:hypothetical protein
MSPCIICTHERVKEINRALLSGWAPKAVADKHGVNVWSIRKHYRKHLPWKHRAARPAETTEEQMADLKLELRRLQILAECGDNVSEALKVIRQRQSLLELEMRSEHKLGATHEKLMPRAKPAGNFKVTFRNGNPVTEEVGEE